MPRKHSETTRLAAVLLAQQSGPDAAAEALGLDRKTVRAWQGTAIPADKWTAIRDLLQARGAEMAAKGDTRGLVATLTAAGIADRNVRYGQLIARREARKAEEQEAEQPSPIGAATQELDPEHKRLLRELFSLEARVRLIERRNGVEEPAAEEGVEDDVVAAWVRRWGTLGPEECKAAIEATTQRGRDALKGYRAFPSSGTSGGYEIHDANGEHWTWVWRLSDLEECIPVIGKPETDVRLVNAPQLETRQALPEPPSPPERAPEPPVVDLEERGWREAFRVDY